MPETSKREGSIRVANGKKPSELTNNSTVLPPLFLVTLLSLFPTTVVITEPKPEEAKTTTSAMATTDIFGVKIEKNPPQSKLDELGVTAWPKWGCEPSKFPWMFEATETLYLLEGKVKVFVDGYEGSFEIGAGDLVIFPKGMKITWDVLEAVKKHYSLEK